MRELKFRAWDKERKLYCNDTSHMFITITGVPHNFQNGCGSDIYDLEQFTGLYDKNEKEIYEGDLCLIYNPYNGHPAKGVAEVIFSHEYVGGWVLTSDKNDKLNRLNIGSRTNEIEVIGNIHENPELLEVI